MNTAVIGGGISGLTLAYRLNCSGKDVTVYERDPHFGGLASSFRLGPTRLDRYFHHIFLSDRSLRRLIAELGLDSDMVWRETKMGFYGRSRLNPFDGAMDLLRLPILPPLDRLRFGWQVWRTGRRRDGESLDSLTVREWIEREWTASIYENFWGPLLRAKFGDAAERISAAWLWGRIYARANSRKGGREKLGYLRGGFSRLTDALAQSIAGGGGVLLPSTPVSRVTREGDGRFLVEDATGCRTFDRVVLCVPSALISDLCPDIPQNERAAHGAIAYQAILCLPIIMKAPLSGIYWLNVGDASVPFTGVVEQTNLLPPSEYGGVHVAYVFNYLPPRHPWFSESKEIIFERYQEGLRRLFPSFKRSDVLEFVLFKDMHATPVYESGYLKKRPPTASSVPNLYYLNTAHIFPDDRNMNFSVELADRLAKQL